MSITLHPHRGKNRWCGPGAIAILTGVTTDDASRMIRAFTGKRNCMGTPTHVVRKVLYECGITSHLSDEYWSGKRPTLNQWVADGLSRGGTYLVIAGNHFQILTDGLFVDNQVKEVTAFEDLKKGKRRRVSHTYRLHCSNGVKMPTHINDVLVDAEMLEEQRKQNRRQVDPTRRKARALAKKLDVSIDTSEWRDWEQLYVYVHDEFADRYGDPWDEGDGHCRFNWEEVLDMLEEEQRRRERRRELGVMDPRWLGE